MYRDTIKGFKYEDFNTGELNNRLMESKYAVIFALSNKLCKAIKTNEPINEFTTEGQDELRAFVLAYLARHETLWWFVEKPTKDNYMAMVSREDMVAYYHNWINNWLEEYQHSCSPLLVEELKGYFLAPVGVEESNPFNLTLYLEPLEYYIYSIIGADKLAVRAKSDNALVNVYIKIAGNLTRLAEAQGNNFVHLSVLEALMPSIPHRNRALEYLISNGQIVLSVCQNYICYPVR